MRRTIIIIVAIACIIGGFFALKTVTNNSTTPGGTSFGEKALSLFPFGNNQTTSTGGDILEETTVISTGDTTTPSSILPRLRQLSSSPTAAAVGISKERLKEDATLATPALEQVPDTEGGLQITESVDYVRYIEKSTGHIYDIAIDEGSPVRTTNTTIPRINEAYFTAGGQGILVRYLENSTIKTWSGTIIGGLEGSTGTLTGTFLDDNISSIAVSPDTNSIVYTKDIGDATYGYTSGISGENTKQVFDTSFSEWLVQWSRASTIAVTAKATGFLEGYTYNIENTQWKKVSGPTFGLTRNADTQGIYSLLSYTTARGMGLQSLNEKTGEKNILPINTFPEKCVWEQNMAVVYCAVPVAYDARTYPDDWYQGTYFSTDTLWRFDVTSGVGTLVADMPKEFGVLIDGVQLGITPNKKMLYFTNKRDNTLWGITL